MKQVIIAIATFALGLGACSPIAEATPTPAPTDVPTLTPVVFPTLPLAFTATPAPATLTPSATPLLVEPLTGIEVEPPFTIALPAGWRYGYDTLLYQDVGEVKSVPIALYKGAVSGGTGTIVLVWNFRSVTTANPLSPDYGKPNLWADGLRLLRALVFDARCNIGTEPEKQYRIGDLPAVGTSFAAVDCPDVPNTRGWFAGVTVEDVNFVFYAYTDPIDAMDGQAQAELTAILESVRFDFSQFRVPRSP